MTDDGPGTGAGGDPGQPGGGEGLEDRLRADLAPEFEVVRHLDSGATADIFLAREPALQRLVTVKVLSPELSEDGVARRRFEREARTAASISHPNVVSIHRVGSLSDGVPYLVMEYVRGQTLAEHLAAVGPMPIGEGREILRSLASALVAAHRSNIVHRDVRPDNVLLEDETGRVLLTDFGIAAILASGSEAVERLTRTGEILGDTTYSSPEQLEGRKPSEQTDVYSLGVLAYELLAGQLPFEADTSQELVMAHLRKEPRRLSELRTGIPADLDRLLQRCLAKNPRQRPTAAQLERLLDADRGEEGEERRKTATEPTDPAPSAPDASAAGPPATGPVSPGPGITPEPEADSGPVASLTRFYRELKRRHVFRVAVVYAAAAWVLIQVAAATFPYLNLPSFAVTLVIVLLAIGFPVALILAWAFQMTPEGVQRTEPDHETPEA